MLKIGIFSKLSRISIRMLRHYDEIGLLRPERVDPSTGYRYYSEAQLLQTERIQALKSLGFGLSVIKTIVEKYEEPQELEKFLLIRQQELCEEEDALRQRLRLIDSAIERLRKDGSMMMKYEVNVKQLPERFVASVRQILPSYQQEGLLWNTLKEETAHLHLQIGEPCYSLAIFHDGEYRERDVDVEVQMCVVGTYPNTEHVCFKTVPPVQVASATYQGSYAQIGAVNAAVAQWIRDNGYEMDGLSFTIYHVSPGQTQNPDEFVTEVCYPVRKKES